MTDKELENITIKIPDNVPVSFLEKLTNFSQDVLMLASEPDDRTETQYMSKYFTYADLANQLSIDFNLGFLSSEIERLQEEKADISSFHHNTIRCDVTTPYIISAITQSGGNITDLEGYRLQDGMHTVFNQASIKADLKIVIPSLTATTKNGGSGTVLTSVTTENGQVKSVGTTTVANIITQIADATKTAPAGNCLTSVTTTDGVVTAVGYIPFSQVVVDGGATTTYIKHIESGSLDTTFTASDKANIKILRCTESQLAQIKSQGRIERNVLYMTT